MKKIKGLFPVVALLLTACNMQAAPAVDQSEISTAAALTVQAALAVTPLATPTLPVSLSDSPTPEIHSTPTTQPMVSAGDDAVNCRAGPGINYARITSIKQGESVKIVGFFPPNFWVVSTNLGECWVAGQYTTPSGSFDAVPTVTLPPTPKGGTPEAPTFPEGGWKYFCAAGKLEVTLSWKEFPADTTLFYEEIPVSAGQVVTYVVTVYNETGEASSKPIALSCE
jgi:hypothetical protein